MSATPGARGSHHLIQSDLRFSMAILNGAIANKDRDDTVWLALSHSTFRSSPTR